MVFYVGRSGLVAALSFLPDLSFLLECLDVTATPFVCSAVLKFLENLNLYNFIKYD